ncbi:hypothetical protein, partial [Yersinia intermedia]|uniref:hypothetical protein n=1 Tax=Yersinia intermedia TaxID=631 RepID=UPI002243D7BE
MKNKNARKTIQKNIKENIQKNAQKRRFLFLPLMAVRYALALFQQINNNPVAGECRFLMCYLPGPAVSLPLGNASMKKTFRLSIVASLLVGGGILSFGLLPGTGHAEA